MVFNGQTLTLSLDTDVTLTGYDGVILFTKPSGVTGQWTATIAGDTVSYNILPADTSPYPGVWKVQAMATKISDPTDIKYGKITVIEFRSHL